MDASRERLSMSYLSIYYHIKVATMENKPKFRPNPKLGF